MLCDGRIVCGCADPYAHRVLEAFCTHPNVGAVLLVSLGCEEFRRGSLRETVKASGRPVDVNPPIYSALVSNWRAAM